jgi:hypothetical protein
MKLLLRLLTVLLAGYVLFMEGQRLWVLLTQLIPQGSISTIRVAGRTLSFITFVSIAIIALILVFRSHIRGARYLGLFLVAFSAQGYWQQEVAGISYLWLALSTFLIGNLLILSMQHFPQTVTAQSLQASIRPRWMQAYLTHLLRPMGLWAILGGAFLLIAAIEYWLPALQSALTNLLILLTALAYLYSNFRLTSGREHDRILWLFWGLFMYTVLTVISYAVFLFDTPSETVRISIAMVYLVVLLVSFVMSVFFADAFDTKIFVRRTAVNATLFLAAVFLYNTIEHYFLHWVSHTLHVSNVMLSSLLSGLLVLFISPLHHKLTALLTRKLKGADDGHH